ncbi:MAG: ribose 5-phosphate isomerase B [Thermoguttaceae bacterium]|jgi:ribose 5-phosphate isomerase B|nr:ribose 5-phosphate isomerase B [Thermoguttaceae bacterium]
MKIMIGSDHHGVQVRVDLSGLLRRLGHDVIDVGPDPENVQPVDYPDIAEKVAGAVSRGEADRGILICGTGIGMSIVANKFPGVRAAPVIDELTAEMSRRHNDLNVLCLSGDLLTELMIDRLVEIWLKSEFAGGRHKRRNDKIAEIERKQIEQNLGK